MSKFGQEQEYTRMEVAALKWLDETDTMQFSQMELLSMFASSQLRQAEQDGWISINGSPDNQGIEVLLYNQKWIDEDWNPKGIRVGFYDDVSGWNSAYWCNYHDDYHKRVSEEDDKQFIDEKGINQIPTHYQPLPSIPKINNTSNPEKPNH